MFGEEGMKEGRGQSRGRFEYVKGKKDFGMFFVHCSPLEETGIFFVSRRTRGEFVVVWY